MISIGFDSKLFQKRGKSRYGEPTLFQSVIGASVRTDDERKFHADYRLALVESLKEFGLEPEFEYYCAKDISEKLSQGLTSGFFDAFTEKISKKVNSVEIYFTLFSSLRTGKVKVYGRIAKRLGHKLSEPSMSYDQLVSEHLSQVFPAVCAWRRSKELSDIPIDFVHFYLDSYQGHIFEGQEELEPFRYSVYPSGDCSNALISTADLIVNALHDRLLRTGLPLIIENTRPLLPEFGTRLRAYPIWNPHLPHLTPLEKQLIPVGKHYPHPVFWVFKNNTLVSNETLKKSSSYRRLVDLAALQGGVVKLFDKEADVNYLKNDDYGVYLDDTGKSAIEIYKKHLKIKLNPINLDHFVGA